MDWIDEAAQKVWDYINDADRPETGDGAIKEVSSIIRAHATRTAVSADAWDKAILVVNLVGAKYEGKGYPLGFGYKVAKEIIAALTAAKEESKK